MDLAAFGLTDIQEAVTPGGIRLLSGSVADGEQDRVWRALRQAHPQTGLWPVLGVSAEEAAVRGGNYAQGLAVLREALAGDDDAHMAALGRARYESSIEGLDPDDPEDAADIAEWQDQFAPGSLVRRRRQVEAPGGGARCRRPLLHR